MAVLEVCCYSMACAREAERCGADRIELCAAPQEGGLTPLWGAGLGPRGDYPPGASDRSPARRRFLLHRRGVRRDA